MLLKVSSRMTIPFLHELPDPLAALKAAGTRRKSKLQSSCSLFSYSSEKEDCHQGGMSWGQVDNFPQILPSFFPLSPASCCSCKYKRNKDKGHLNKMTSHKSFHSAALGSVVKHLLCVYSIMYTMLTMIKVKILSCMSVGRAYLGFSNFTSLSLQKSFFTTKD